MKGPRGVAKNPVEAARVGGLDVAHGGLERAAHVLGGGAHVLPVSALGDDEALVGGIGGVGGVAGVGEGLGEVLIPHVGASLVEEERKDELLVVADVHEAAEDDRRGSRLTPWAGGQVRGGPGPTRTVRWA